MKLIKRLFILVLIIGAFFAGVTYYQGRQQYTDAVAQVPVEEKIQQIRSMENYTAYSQLPRTYVDAVIAAEDKRFRDHGGYDIISIGRAVWNNIKAGELREGGSTITQQLARIMYFQQDTKLSRKLAEIFVAGDIEEICDKDEILELYVNAIYFGSGYYGIYEASQGYFGKDPEELNDYECTMLAGIPNAPSVYSPDVNPDLAEQRRQQVIGCMIEEGYIEEGQIQ